MKYFLLIILWTLPIFSSPRWIQNYSFVKDLKISNYKDTNSFGKFDLDEDIYRSFYDFDLRISYNGKPIPYIRRIKQRVDGRSGKLNPIVIFEKSTDEGTNYVLEIPPLPSNSRLENLELKANDFFETSAKVYLGNEIDQWKLEKNAFIFKYDNSSDSNNLTLKIDSDYFKYIRIETEYKDSIQFKSINYGPKDMVSHIEYKELVPENKINGDTQSSQYYFNNETAKPFQIVRLQFKETDYSRNFSIYAMDEEKEYKFLSSGTLLRIKKSPYDYSEIYLDKTISTPWKLEIFDQDSNPLQLSSVQLYQPKEECIFKFPEDYKASDPIKVYYGYKYASLPSYDTSGFPENSNQTLASLLVLEQKMNPDKSWSLFEPPISIWITRALFFFGLLVTILLGYKILLNWSRSSEPNAN